MKFISAQALLKKRTINKSIMDKIGPINTFHPIESDTCSQVFNIGFDILSLNKLITKS
jgi:hypothetical protein